MILEVMDGYTGTMSVLAGQTETLYSSDKK